MYSDRLTPPHFHGFLKVLMFNLFISRFDESFFTFCDKELAKINTFYAEKIAEATRKFAMLKSELEGPESENLVKKKKIQKRKNVDMKLAFSEFYLSLILLQNYQNLNFTGFRKILKKHDKLLKTPAGGKHYAYYNGSLVKQLLQNQPELMWIRFKCK